MSFEGRTIDSQEAFADRPVRDDFESDEEFAVALAEWEDAQKGPNPGGHEDDVEHGPGHGWVDPDCVSGPGVK